MFIPVTSPEPSWPSTIGKREAILWLAPSFDISLFEQVVSLPWSAIYVDIPRLLSTTLAKANPPRTDGLILRVYDNDAGPDVIPPNRIPIFCLRGPSGSVAAAQTANPMGLMTRYSMLQKAMVGQEIFVFGADTPEAIDGLREAIQVNPKFQRLTVIGPECPQLDEFGKLAERLVHWNSGWSTFRELLPQYTKDAARLAEFIRFRKHSGIQELDLGPSIDPSYPISATFDVIPSHAVLEEVRPTEDNVREFLADPCANWTAYSAGIPYPRHRDIEKALLSVLKKFHHEGSVASCTAWIQAEDGSGATTVLRQVCFNLARQGYPVLIARQGASKFDFAQLSRFLTAVAERLASDKDALPDIPWVIAFDAEHTEQNWGFIVGLCNGLKKLQKCVVVLGIRAGAQFKNEFASNALGSNRILGAPLVNTLSTEDGVQLGEHLAKFLSPGRKRGRDEWQSFVEDTIRTTPEGKKSLFWVALRFWLFRLPGADQHLRQWLADKFDQMAVDNPYSYAGLLEVAALARYRLVAPFPLLLKASADALRNISMDGSNVLGLRLLRSGTDWEFTFAHPLIAEELLRIAQGNMKALSAVDKPVCFNLLDLELHLLGRLISRPTAGDKECMRVIEEVVTSALRVDPREAPRNYQVRGDIVKLLEKAPATLWDSSQVFNHHVAKARRHLALDPPDRNWTAEMRCSQLELAERHLADALHHVQPEDEEHRESPLNLWVSLALTYDARSRLEGEWGDSAKSRDYLAHANAAYQSAQALDPGVSLVDHLGQQQEIVATEAVGGFPLLAILVDAGDGDVKAVTVSGLVLPDSGFDRAETDFMDRLNRLLLRHGNLRGTDLIQRPCYPPQPDTTKWNMRSPRWVGPEQVTQIGLRPPADETDVGKPWPCWARSSNKGEAR